MLVATALSSPAVCAEVVKLVPSADYFFDEAAQTIWRAVLELTRRKVQVDLAAVQARVGAQVPPMYLADLAAAYPKPPANLSHHVASLRWDRARNEAVRGPLAALLEALRDPAARPDQVRALARTTARVFDVATDLTFMSDPDALAREVGEELARSAQQALYPLGLPGLDVSAQGLPVIVPGAAPGLITTVTGVSGNGKSMVAAMIALEQARRGRRVLYGAWEMGRATTIMLLAMMSLGQDEPTGPWTRTAIVQGKLTAREQQWLKERSREIAEYVRFFPPPFQHEVTRRYRNHDALDVLGTQIADSGCEVYVLDMWERMIPDGRPEDERRALFRQQQITQETRTHGVLVCQQRGKDIEASDDKRPTREGILGSSAWIDISDHTIGVFRPALYKPIPDDLIELLVLKQRYGVWPMAVECTWDGDRVRLSDPRDVTRRLPQSTKADGISGFLDKPAPKQRPHRGKKR